MTLTLADFLLARIAEDEARVYRADSDGEYRVAWARIKVAPAFFTTVAADHANGEWVAGGDHLGEKYGPENVTVGEPVLDARRLLAECEAKRRIIAAHPLCSPGNDHCVCECDWGGDGNPCATLCALALPYADHPDCRQEWRR